MSWPSWLNSSPPQPSPESGRHASILEGAQGGSPPPPPSTAGASNQQPASGGWGSVAHDVVGHREDSTTTTANLERSGSHCSSSSSRPKRKRDEEPAVARSSSAPSVGSSARDVEASVDGMMDVDDGVETEVGPASKRSREAAPARESGPPQSYASRMFRITHHKEVPGVGEKKGPPLFSTGKRPPASAAGGGKRRWSGGTQKDNRSLSHRPRQPGRVSRHSSAPADTSRYSRHPADGAESPGRSASRFSAGAGAGTSTSNGSSRLSFGGGAAAGRSAAADNEDDGSSNSAMPGGSPPLVVIDGSNTAFGYREGYGRWRAEGPLLAIQYFEARGVRTVTFIPRQRVDSVSPQDDVYPAFQEARASGAISLVPAGGNDDLYFLKYAIDHNAPVVSNDRFRDHAGNDETLAVLGRTRAELWDFLSEHQVGYTFARDEFVPNPEAQVIKELTRYASDRRASPSYEATGAPSRHTPPPRLLEDERDSQTKPRPPLQPHERYERGYFVSERRPP